MIVIFCEISYTSVSILACFSSYKTFCTPQKFVEKNRKKPIPLKLHFHAAGHARLPKTSTSTWICLSLIRFAAASVCRGATIIKSCHNFWLIIQLVFVFAFFIFQLLRFHFNFLRFRFVFIFPSRRCEVLQLINVQLAAHAKHDHVHPPPFGPSLTPPLPQAGLSPALPLSWPFEEAAESGEQNANIFSYFYLI